MSEKPSTAPRAPRMDPWWRKARIAARLLLKKEAGLRWNERDRRLARRLADDPGVTNRLLDQAVHSISARQRNGRSILDILNLSGNAGWADAQEARISAAPKPVLRHYGVWFSAVADHG